MKDRINIEKLLKDCPEGMELYSPLCGKCFYKGIEEKIHPDYKLVVKTQKGTEIWFDEFGNYFKDFDDSKCLLFPSKDQQDWSKFQRPFKDGDILTSELGSIFILKTPNEESLHYGCYIALDYASYIVENCISFCSKKSCRFATAEEKQKLFNAIKAKGYRWDAETKTLRKPGLFNAGDVLVSEAGNVVLFSHIDDKQFVWYHCILYPISGFRIAEGTDCGIGKVHNCKLATDKQKDKLFDKLQKSGYKYNPQTNKLEKLVESRFKNGDIVAVTLYPEGTWIGIFKRYQGEFFVSHCSLNTSGQFRHFELSNHFLAGVHLATEKEKEKLFKAIKEHGYHWNVKNKSLDKLPKFKIGDRIVKKNSGCISMLITKIRDNYYYINTESSAEVLSISEQDDYELVFNKFDINTLIPFESKVLVRDSDYSEWKGSFWGHLKQGNDMQFDTIRGVYRQCIPYNGDTKHLLGKTNSCDEYYKNW